jgi:hypothetical protein
MRAGVPSAAGDALQMLPAMVPAFWTWSPPISLAAATRHLKSGGKPASTMSLQVVVAPMRQWVSCSVIPRSPRMPVTSRTPSRIECADRAA